MKQEDIWLGKRVVVSEDVGATIYIIREIEPHVHRVRLVYTLLDGQEANGGWADRRTISLPSNAQLLDRVIQLENALIQIHDKD